MATSKKATSAFSDLVSDIIATGMERSKDVLAKMNVIEFATEILNIKLWPTQRAILKALYNLPFQKGLWRDILPCVPWEDEDGVKWPHGKLQKWGFDIDEEWDEEEILNEWVLHSKSTWKKGGKYSELNLEHLGTWPPHSVQL